MSGDLSGLAAMCPALKDTEKQVRGVVDLLTVDKQVRRSSGDGKAVSPARARGSLVGVHSAGFVPCGQGERLGEEMTFSACGFEGEVIPYRKPETFSFHQLLTNTVYTNVASTQAVKKRSRWRQGSTPLAQRF